MGYFMIIEINKVEYDNRAPYEDEKDSGYTYKLLNKHLMELGYGSFNCNDLYTFWNDISDRYSACWLDVPEDINEFKRKIGYIDDDIEYIDDYGGEKQWKN